MRDILTTLYSSAELTTMLTEAASAYHLLATGAKEVEVFVIDRKTKYHESDLPALRAWMTEIKAAIDGSKRCPLRPLAVT